MYITQKRIDSVQHLNTINQHAIESRRYKQTKKRGTKKDD